MAKTTDQLVLIDGHAMLYRAYFAFPPTLTTKTGELINAVYGFTRILLSVIDDLKPSHLAASFDVGKTFRHQEFPAYKAHREKMPDDLKSQEHRAFDVIKALNIPLFVKPGFEADDVIGTLSHLAAAHEGLNTLIVTGDMDALQLVTDPKISVYVPGRSQKPAQIFHEPEVMEKTGLSPRQIPDYKGLAGDSSDNIPGVRGIGQKTAVKLLQAFGTLENTYQALDQNSSPELIKGALKNKLEQGREIAFESRRLATIVTTVPLDFDLPACEVRAYDKSKAVSLFEALQFKSLIPLLPDDDFELSVKEALW